MWLCACRSSASLPLLAANQGSCIIRMRPTIVLSGGINTNPPSVTPAQTAAAPGIDNQALNNVLRTFTCRPVTFLDLLNVLDVSG